MGRYTDFTLYWETWGGYPDREEPFGLPHLTWFVASADSAARCLVRSEPKGSMEITWSAEWHQLPHDLLAPVPDLLKQAGAFGTPAPLVEDSTPGDYVQCWQLTGVLHERPFHLAVQFPVPGTPWTPLGQRLSNTLTALATYHPDENTRR